MTVLPVVVLVVEGASFEYLKVSRPKNGIVDNRSVLEPRRLREALVVRVCFLLVGGGVPILLRELLTAGLVLLGSYIMRRRPPTWSPTGGLVQWRQWTLEPVLLGERFKRAVGRGSSSVEELCIKLCVVPEPQRALSPV